MTRRNITADEKAYDDRIGELVAQSSNDLISTAPFLFSNRVSVQTLITRYELYKMILDVPGDVVECGVYQGNSFLWLAHLSLILEPHAVNRKFVGFDTFDGFTAIDPENDPKDISSDNFSDTSYETIKQSLDAVDLVRPVNKIQRFELVKGDITNTIPEYVNDHPAFTCSMLILDTDLYRPTLTALESIIPHMPKGGLVVLDEYNYQNFAGETKALKDFQALGNFRLKKFRHDSCLAYFVI